MFSTEVSPLDRALDVAEFGDRRAIKHRQKTVSLRDLSKRLPPAISKETMNHIKLGTFSGEPTVKGSYRHNAAHESVSGVEGDYDKGEMSPQDAVAALAKAGVAALVYTTPSHQQDGKGHRWRVLCPLSADTMPSERSGLLARVNGVLDGKLGNESFTASQSFNYGRIKGNPEPEVHLVDGRFLDHCTDLDSGKIGKTTVERGEPRFAQDLSHDTFRVDIPVAAPLREALDKAAMNKKAVTILTTTNDTSWTSDGFRTTWRKVVPKSKVTGLTFHDLRGTAVTRLALAGCSEAEIATITGHSLKDVGAILDAHYLSRNSQLAESAMKKRELYEGRTKTPN